MITLKTYLKHKKNLFYVILLSYVTDKFILLKTNSLRTNENKY